MAGPESTLPTLSIVIGVLAVIVSTRLRRGSLISPFSLTIFILVSIFGVRPILMLRYHEFDFYGINVVDGFGTAAKVGLISIICVILGYAVGTLTGADKARRTPRQRKEKPQGYSGEAVFTIHRAFAATAITVAVWLAAVAALGGGLSFVQEMFAGRSAAVKAEGAGLPMFVPALPLAGAVLLAYARRCTERARPLNPWERTLYWTGVALAVVPPAALGSRRFMLPCIVVAAIGASTRTWRRRVRLPVILASFATLLVMATIPFIRSAGARTPGENFAQATASFIAQNGVTGVLKDYFLSFDTEMFNYVAYLGPKLGQSWPYGYGRGTFIEAVQTPIPARFGFTTWSDQILTHTFGGGCAQQMCPVASLPGTLFFDFGLAGVIAGLFLFGVLCRRLESALQLAENNRSILLLLVAGLIPILVRGNPITGSWIIMNALVASLILRKLLSKNQRLIGPGCGLLIEAVPRLSPRVVHRVVDKRSDNYHLPTVEA